MKVLAQQKGDKRILKGKPSDAAYYESTFGKQVQGVLSQYDHYKGPLKVKAKNVTPDPDAQDEARLNTKDSTTLSPQQMKLIKKSPRNVV